MRKPLSCHLCVGMSIKLSPNHRILSVSERSLKRIGEHRATRVLPRCREDRVQNIGRGGRWRNPVPPKYA